MGETDKCGIRETGSHSRAVLVDEEESVRHMGCITDGVVACDGNRTHQATDSG